MNGSEHGSSTSARSSNSCGEASLVTSSLTSDDGSGTTSPTGSSDSSSIASAQFPWNVAAMLHQLQQGSDHNNFAQATTLVQKALAEEIQRAQLLQSQLAALDKAAMAQASAAQQQAALLASSGISVPPALQQAAVVNALLLNGSLAAQARSGLTPMSLGALAGAAAALQPPNLTSLLQQHQLKTIMPLNSNINPQPGNLSTNTLTQTQPAVTEVEYRDASLLPDPVDTTTKCRAEPFPVKLHRMLSELEQEGKDDVCSFLPHGRAFVVHKPKQFANEIMPKYFRMSRFSSFQRQLNLYDFKRLTEGKDKGAYYHELFLYGRPALTTQMKRTKIKGNARLAGSVYHQDIDFYKMPPVPKQEAQENSLPDGKGRHQQEGERNVQTLHAAVSISG